MLIIVCFFFIRFTAASYEVIEILSLQVRRYFGGYYLLIGLLCVLILIGVAISPWGNYKLGLASDKPAFSRLAWIAMLYSAGMGAGILLRAVQEPVYMLQNPPLQHLEDLEISALEFTFYQWGFTAWAFYGIFALAIGTVVFKFKRPLLTSSTVIDATRKPRRLISVLGSFTIDQLTILTTVFGLVAAVGLGATQIKGGIDFLSENILSSNYIIGLVILTGLLALISAWSGIEKGIKRLSTLNIIITLILLTFVFAQSDIPETLRKLGLASYHYIIDFIPMSLALGKYNPGIAFLTDWTYYYWAFWIAWAPFTGIFIARISRGRTLREIIIGTLLIPSLGTFFWFSVFGNSAFDIIENWGSYQGEFDNVFSSLFIFLAEYPLQSLTSITVIVLLISFLVTSLDSAIYVLSSFTSKTREEPSKKHRIIWSIILTASAAGLVLLGESRPESNVLVAAQKLLIVTSLPLSFFIVIMAYKWLSYLKNWNKSQD
ncbi:MAG: glycine/betaine ABC transporter [Leeuwenhoekiella sp.]|nr:glycine/betaine ABC transporter [Leeuwenhoekiella sp.]MBA81185.1 glycine/betaine ABC transporter [Leeuwenhoekiella sp.]